MSLPDWTSLGTIPLNGFVDPITYFYPTVGAAGAHTYQLTVNTRGLSSFPQAAGDLGDLLWDLTIARAMSTTTTMTGSYGFAWRTNGTVAPRYPILGHGRLFELPAGRSSCAVWVLNTGQRDQLGARRWYFNGTPAGWSSGGIMKESGLHSLEGLALSMLMGMTFDLPGCPLDWWIAYPGTIPADEVNPLGVSFRKVREVAIVEHTGRMPVPSL